MYIYRRIKVQTILYFLWRIGAEMLESLWIKIKVSLRRFDTKLTPNTLAILPYTRSVHQQITVHAWTVLVARFWALRVTDISCRGRGEYYFEHFLIAEFMFWQFCHHIVDEKCLNKSEVVIFMNGFSTHVWFPSYTEGIWLPRWLHISMNSSSRLVL